MTESDSLTALEARGSKSGCRGAEPPQVLGRKYTLPLAPATPASGVAGTSGAPGCHRRSAPLSASLLMWPSPCESVCQIPLLARTEVTGRGRPEPPVDIWLCLPEKQFNARHHESTIK